MRNKDKIQINPKDIKSLQKTFRRLRGTQPAYYVKQRSIVDIYNKNDEHLLTLPIRKFERLPLSEDFQTQPEEYGVVVHLAPKRHKLTARVTGDPTWYYLPYKSPAQIHLFFKNLDVDDYIGVSSKVIRGDEVSFTLSPDNLTALKNMFQGVAQSSIIPKTNSALINSVRGKWKY